MSKKPWYINDIGPNKDLRIFFNTLLRECIGMTSGSGEINDIDVKYISDQKRPFVNAFSSSQKGKHIFTPKICQNFLELTLRRNSINKAVQIIKSSDYGFFCKNLDKCDFKKIELCSSIQPNHNHEYLECIKFVSDNKHFKKTCGNCPVKLIYDALPNIENECRTRFIGQKKILENYVSPEDKKTISSIYEYIQKFENDFKNKPFTTDIICELFNTCVQCINIKDVYDIKMAYVKWYTARLCTWPYFKSCLLQLDKYDESIVYSLLRSASAICSALPITKEYLKLFCDIEIDKIISYISLAYQNPFAINYCESPETILTNCSRIIEVQSDCQTLLDLCTEIWNLTLHAQKGSDFYKEKIEYLSQQNQTLDSTKYYVYSYLYNLCGCEIPKKLLSQKAKQLKNNGAYDDTINIMTEIFLAKASGDNNFFDSGNPYVDIMTAKGNDTAEINTGVEKTNIPAAPSTYKRTYGDNMLTGFFEEYKKYRT